VKYFLLFLLIIKCQTSISQALQLDDLIKVYSMDSSSFKQYCNEKGLRLKESSRYKKNVFFTYLSDSFSIERVYSKTVLAIVTFRTSFVNQYFSLKKSFKRKGFKAIRGNIVKLSTGIYYLSEKFYKDLIWFELISTNSREKGTDKYVLILSNKKELCKHIYHCQDNKVNLIAKFIRIIFR
jgi:hypothetical protein